MVKQAFPGPEVRSSALSAAENGAMCDQMQLHSWKHMAKAALMHAPTEARLHEGRLAAATLESQNTFLQKLHCKHCKNQCKSSGSYRSFIGFRASRDSSLNLGGYEQSFSTSAEAC